MTDEKITKIGTELQEDYDLAVERHRTLGDQPTISMKDMQKHVDEMVSEEERQRHQFAKDDFLELLRDPNDLKIAIVPTEDGINIHDMSKDRWPLIGQTEDNYQNICIYCDNFFWGDKYQRVCIDCDEMDQESLLQIWRRQLLRWWLKLTKGQT